METRLASPGHVQALAEHILSAASVNNLETCAKVSHEAL